MRTYFSLRTDGNLAWKYSNSEMSLLRYFYNWEARAASGGVRGHALAKVGSAPVTRGFSGPSLFVSFCCHLSFFIDRVRFAITVFSDLAYHGRDLGQLVAKSRRPRLSFVTTSATPYLVSTRESSSTKIPPLHAINIYPDATNHLTDWSEDLQPNGKLYD